MSNEQRIDDTEPFDLSNRLKIGLLSSEDWTYPMRRTMQQIVPGVYLGPYSAAQRTKLDVLKQHGITHIVCVRQDVEAHFIRPNFPDTFQYLVVNIADSPTENIIQHFSAVKNFVDKCLNGGGKVLIHGNAGISRSAALAVAYIMETYSVSLKDAFTLVQQVRFCINPNVGFMAQLAEFEPIYKAQQDVLQGSEGPLRCLLPITDEKYKDVNHLKLFCLNVMAKDYFTSLPYGKPLRI